MSESLTGELWHGSAGVYQAILEHPFLNGLTDGTLAPDAFAFYVVQDALYLRKYSEALAAVGARAPDAAAGQMFARHAAEAITVEQELHTTLLPELGIGPEVIGTAEPAPTTLAYTSHLLATVSTGSYCDGVAAVLPCYWIYWEVGRELLRRGSPDARYQRWIDTYGSEEFGGVVRQVLDVTDRLGPGLAPADRARARQHFHTSSRYEWMFWDMSYRQERWPL